MGCEFTQLISEAAAQTQTGSELINKYKAHLMASPESCALINQFIREASNVRYDNGVNKVLEILSDYINCNSVSWSLASACESINNNTSSSNYLNRNAARQVENLLEMDEENVTKYIRSGAMKNVMFCEAFRNIAKQVFNNSPIVEHTAEYTKFTPVSMVESVNDNYYFVVSGKLYKINEGSERGELQSDLHVEEGQWNEVSNTFKTVESLLESQICSVDEDDININYNNKTYTINEVNKVKIGEKEFTTEQFRDDTNLLLTVANPRRRNEIAGVMEAVAQVAENYNQIVTLDNTAIYSTANDRFVVIECGSKLYAELLKSNHNTGWKINEDAIKACEYIKKQTNTQISENYKTSIENAVNEATQESKQQMMKTLEDNNVLSLKERIELLTEKFKNDPTKLAVLSKLASEVSSL